MARADRSSAVLSRHDLEALYRPLAGGEGEDADAGVRCVSGQSWIQVGDHRYWNLRRALSFFTVDLLLILGVFGVPLLGIAFALLDRVDSELGLRALVSGFLVVAVAGSCLGWVTGHGLWARRFVRRHLGAVGGVVVTVRFRPELTLARRVSIGHSDDTGVLHFEPDALVFRGERIDARIARSQVERIATGGRTAHAAYLGHALVMELEPALAGATRMSVVSHDALTPFGGRASSRQLAARLGEWMGRVG